MHIASSMPPVIATPMMFHFLMVNGFRTRGLSPDMRVVNLSEKEISTTRKSETEM